ncbi:hypothetical protein LAZ67_23001638 [Cordylochernes scorpioides]|uniref:Mos1 transposase HTH domain-containing protein n=1 Tax=Cordylochernes scorpioides TaxID=51811 RepID=A0ABY6LR93_9ARAC|nr:hypothetical protein LAZ67_23001638 [Cordylochernes scorpioides]
MLGFHRHVKAKTSFQDDDVPIDDDTTTKPLFTPQENGGKETLALINEANEDLILSQTQVYFWYKRFKDGLHSIADDSRSGRPLTSTRDRNIGQVRDSIVADGKSNIDNISEILGISYGSCQKILVNI